jgi:hypothetical protein
MHAIGFPNCKQKASHDENILTCLLEAKDLQTTGVELKVLRRTRLRARNSGGEEEGQRGGRRGRAQVVSNH